MFRRLRNEKKAISEECAKKLLSEAPRGILAVNGDDDMRSQLTISMMSRKVESTSTVCMVAIKLNAWSDVTRYALRCMETSRLRKRHGHRTYRA